MTFVWLSLTELKGFTVEPGRGGRKVFSCFDRNGKRTKLVLEIIPYIHIIIIISEIKGKLDVMSGIVQSEVFLNKK